MCPRGRNGWSIEDFCFIIPWANLMIARTAEQSEGGKVVAVDSTLITARQLKMHPRNSRELC